MAPTELIGQKYGRLIIIGEAEPRMNRCGKRKRMVVARCDCGIERLYQLGNLKSGNSKSCGCYDAEVLAARNTESSRPQEWTVDGDVAFTEISGIRVLVDATDASLVGRYRWYVDGNGYVDSAQCDPMHRLILGLHKGDPREGDHIHHVLTDNRRSQLRIAISSQNHGNTRGRKVRASRYKGVTPSRGRWRAQIATTSLGRFSSEEAAARAYDAAAKIKFGEFAFLNFPEAIRGSHA